MSTREILGDIKSPALIYIKGFLFLFAGIIAVATLLLENYSPRNLCLLVIAIWSFCRFYYFMFYVIEHYVDGNYKFSSIYSFVVYLVRRRKQ